MRSPSDLPLTNGLEADGTSPVQTGAGVTARPPSAHGQVFSRIGHNIGWLLGGRGFAGIVSLAYLAIAARALGATAFGQFSLVLAYGGAIANFAQFSSWRAVIRYGATHLAQERADRLARLLGLLATADWACAISGAVVAACGVPLAGPLLGWTAAQQHEAALFSAVLLLSTGGAATGLLRLRNRFDLLTWSECVGPLVRLLGAAAVWMSRGGVNAMLCVWGAAAFAEMSAGWISALTLGDTRISFGRESIKKAVAENPRIWSFILQSSAAGSLNLLWEQAGTLAVGGYGGPAAAGAFRVASKLASALSRPAETVTRALYPELAHLAASKDRATLAHVSRRTTWVAALAALAIVALVYFGGPTLLRLVSGRAFMFAQPFLLLLTIAAAIDLCGLVFEPILNAHGSSGRILVARVLGAAAYLLALVLFLPAIGAVGAAFAAIASSIVIRGTMSVFAARIIRNG